jgi:hypothetical protein
MSVGNVYYFNATPNKVELLNNNHILKESLGGIEKSTGYVAPAGTAERNSANESGNKTFGEHNKFVVSFPDGTSQEYPVTIDSNAIHIDRDVQLYIFFNQVVLVTPEGNGSATVIAGRTLSDAEIEELK